MRNKIVTKGEFKGALRELKSIKGSDIRDSHKIAVSLVVSYVGSTTLNVGAGHINAFMLSDGKYIHSMTGDHESLVNMVANRMLSDPDYFLVIIDAVKCVNVIAEKEKNSKH